MQTEPIISATAGRQRKPSGTQKPPSSEPRIRVRPTRYGTTFLFILGAMLLGSLNTNNNLGFLLTFLLGSMAAVSVLYTRLNLTGIRLTGIRAKPVFTGEPAGFSIGLSKPGQSAWAVLAAFPGENPVPADLSDGSPVTLHIDLPTRQRGLLTPGPIEIATRYPFGLFQARTSLPHAAVCLVYPRPITGPPATTPGDTASGMAGGGAGAGVDDFVGLQAYQPGDNLGQISWKAYSRGQGLLIKQFMGEAGRTLTVDWYTLNEPDLERKLSRLCGMVLHARQTGLPFGLRLPTGTIAPARGEQHLKACLSDLALFGLPGDGAGVRSGNHPTGDLTPDERSDPGAAP